MPTRKKSHKNNTGATRQWRKMDLHLHTPASVDYREQNVSYLDFFKKAEERGLDIVAFSDHNTVAGYERYLKEVESLTLLERLNRLTDAEREQLSEYRRLQEKLLILPGFEITATLGFHILGIFSPDTSVRELEHLLLALKVPPDKLDLGSGEVGATSDVLTIYRQIDEAGGLVIAAHANSSHGVAMPGFDFGGQTRISYTQDSHLHGLEVTDLTSKSRRRTALFFSGTKPEYPRRMHLIQSSDAHRLTGLPHNNQELGVGDRATEILLDELSFDAIKDVFLGNDFARVRPYVPSEPQAFDPISQAREEGDTLVQAFHESLMRGRTIERKIIQDVVALANTNGGTIYVGLSANTRQPVMGIQRPGEGIHQLRAEISKCVVPPLEVQLDAQKIGTKSVVRIIVPRGSEVPYALEGTQIFVRSENETSLAVRDEIVNLVRDSVAMEFAAKTEAQERAAESPAPVAETAVETAAPPDLPAPPPRTGVQVIPTERRKGELQYAVRDLRNNRLIHNVTRSSARKLWQYAISDYEEHPIDPKQVKWQGDIGLCKAHKRAGKLRYDLVQRDRAGTLHIYYGVTEDGIHGVWKSLIEAEGENGEIETEEENEHPETERPEAESFEDMASEQFENPFTEEPRVTSWPNELVASTEQNEVVPSELDVESGELRSITDMGFQIESIPEEAIQPSPQEPGEWSSPSPTVEQQQVDETQKAESAPPMGDHAGPSYGEQPNVEQPPTGTSRFDAVGERLIEEGESHPAGEPPTEPPVARTEPVPDNQPPTEAKIHQEIINAESGASVEPEPMQQPQWQAPQAPTEKGPDAAVGAQFNPPSPAEAVPPSAEVTAEQFASLDSSAGESMLPPVGPEGASPESNQAKGEQQPTLNTTPGRFKLPKLNAAETSLPSPLDISPDTNTMGEHQGTAEENRAADENPPQP